MLSSLGSVAQREGDLGAALDLYRRVRRSVAKVGFLLWTLWQLDSQLEVEVELGLLSDAEQTAQRGLELATRLEDRRLTCRSSPTSASPPSAVATSSERERCGAQSSRRFEDLPAGFSEYLTAAAAPLRDSTAERFVAAVERGQNIPLDEAVSLVLEPDQTEP